MCKAPDNNPRKFGTLVACTISLSLVTLAVVKSFKAHEITLWQIFHFPDEPPPKFPAPDIAARNAQIAAAITAQRSHHALIESPIPFPIVQNPDAILKPGLNGWNGVRTPIESSAKYSVPFLYPQVPNSANQYQLVAPIPQVPSPHAWPSTLLIPSTSIPIADSHNQLSSPKYSSHVAQTENAPTEENSESLLGSNLYQPEGTSKSSPNINLPVSEVGVRSTRLEYPNVQAMQVPDPIGPISLPKRLGTSSQQFGWVGDAESTRAQVDNNVRVLYRIVSSESNPDEAGLKQASDPSRFMDAGDELSVPSNFQTTELRRSPRSFQNKPRKNSRKALAPVEKEYSKKENAESSISDAVRVGYRAAGERRYTVPYQPVWSDTSINRHHPSSTIPTALNSENEDHFFSSGVARQPRIVHRQVVNKLSPAAVSGQDSWIKQSWPASPLEGNGLLAPARSSLVAQGAALAAKKASKAAAFAMPSSGSATTLELSQDLVQAGKAAAIQRLARKHAALAGRAWAQSLVTRPVRKKPTSAGSDPAFVSTMTKTLNEAANPEVGASAASVHTGAPVDRTAPYRDRQRKPLATALVPDGVRPGEFFSSDTGRLGVMLITVPAGARPGSRLGLYSIPSGEGSTLEWILEPPAAEDSSDARHMAARGSLQRGTPVFSGLLQLPVPLSAAARTVAYSRVPSAVGVGKASPLQSRPKALASEPKARLLSMDEVEKLSQWQTKELQRMQAQDTQDKGSSDRSQAALEKDVDGVEHEAITARGAGGKPVVIGQQAIVPQCSKVCDVCTTCVCCFVLF